MSRESSKTMIPPAPRKLFFDRMEGSSRVTPKSAPARKPPESPAIVTAWTVRPGGGPPAQSCSSSLRGSPRGTS